MPSDGKSRRALDRLEALGKKGDRFLASLAGRTSPLPSWWRRVRCRLFGHRPVLEERGAPVTTFQVCRWCGKWSRD